MNTKEINVKIIVEGDENVKIYKKCVKNKILKQEIYLNGKLIKALVKNINYQKDHFAMVSSTNTNMWEYKTKSQLDYYMNHNLLLIDAFDENEELNLIDIYKPHKKESIIKRVFKYIFN